MGRRRHSRRRDDDDEEEDDYDDDGDRSEGGSTGVGWIIALVVAALVGVVIYDWYKQYKKAVAMVATAASAQSTVDPVKASERSTTYKFFKSWDTKGNELVYKPELKDKIEDLKAACNANTGCYAFNNLGYLKSGVEKNSLKWTRPGVSDDTYKGIYIQDATVKLLKKPTQRPFRLFSGKDPNLCLGQYSANDLGFVKMDSGKCDLFFKDADDNIRNYKDPRLTLKADQNGNENGRRIFWWDEPIPQKWKLQTNKTLQHVASGRCVHPDGGNPAANWKVVTWNQCSDSGDNIKRIQYTVDDNAAYTPDDDRFTLLENFSFFR